MSRGGVLVGPGLGATTPAPFAAALPPTPTAPIPVGRNRGAGEAWVKRSASPLHDLKIMPSANFLQDLIEVERPLPLEKIHAPFLALLSTGRTFADPDITRARLSRLPQGEIHTLESNHWIPTGPPLSTHN